MKTYQIQQDYKTNQIYHIHPSSFGMLTRMSNWTVHNLVITLQELTKIQMNFHVKTLHKSTEPVRWYSKSPQFCTTQQKTLHEPNCSIEVFPDIIRSTLSSERDVDLNPKYRISSHHRSAGKLFFTTGSNLTFGTKQIALRWTCKRALYTGQLLTIGTFVTNDCPM